MIWNDSAKEVWVTELTVCFKSSYDEAHTRKTVRYKDTMEKIATYNLDGKLVTLKVKLAAMISSITLQQQLLECIKKQCRRFLTYVSEAATQGSLKVWVMQNWTEPQS